MTRTFRVAVVVSHAVQHFCPQYTSWAKRPGIDLRVFLASDHGLSAYADSGFERDVRWDGIRLDFPHEFLRDSTGRTVSDNLDAADLTNRLATFSPDAVVVYGYSQRLQRRAARWACSGGAALLMIADSELRAPRNRLVRALKGVVVPYLLKDVTLFLTAGDANEAYYRHYGVSDSRFVRCFFPIDIHHHDSVIARRHDSRDKVRSALGIPADHKVLLTVGKLLPRKRHVDLVEFSNSLHHRNDVTVVIAGSGPEETSLRASARHLGSGGLVFAGFVPPERLAEYYCAADVYVHCSDNEPHSLAISEAIYCGLPVVLSDRCGSYGPTDDVQPGLNGFVYRCGDVRDLSLRINQVLEDDSLHAQMCEASTRIGGEHQALAHGEALAEALAILAGRSHSGVFSRSMSCAGASMSSSPRSVLPSMRFHLPESLWPASLDARPLASTAVAGAALAVVGLLTGMLAARLLGAEGRGELAAAQAWPLFLANLGSFGVTDAIAYFGARSPVRARAVLATGLLLTAPFVLVALAAGAWLLPQVLGDQRMEVLQVATLSLALVPLLILSTAPSHALRGVGRYRAWNALRLVAPLAWLTTLLAVRGSDHATVPTLALAFIGATALAALITHLYAWWTLAGRAAPERDLVRPMLAYSAPTMAATIPRWLNLRIDQLIVIALLDARALGLYVVGVAWSGAARPLADVVAHNAVPALAGTKNNWQRARLVYRTGALAAIGTSVLLLAATPILLPLIFGAEFRAAIPVALVMVFAGAVEAMNAVGAECLRGVGRPRAVLVAECVGLAVTVVALPVLVLTAGIVGAACAALLSSTVILIAQRRLMRAPREDAQLEFAASPPMLDPVA